MRLLVISADGNEAVLPAIRETLDYVGTPYDVHIATQPGLLTAAMLSDGACFGRYQGIILTTGELGHAVKGRLGGQRVQCRGVDHAAAVSSQLQDSPGHLVHVSAAAVRLWPRLRKSTPTFTPVSATLTAEGAAVFSYLNPATVLTIKNAHQPISRRRLVRASHRC